MPAVPAPLAAAVCPSAPFLAPFLAPRLLRAPAVHAAAATSSPHRALSTTPRCCDNAARGKKSGRSYFLEMRRREAQQASRVAARTGAQREAAPEVVELARGLQRALEQGSADAVMALYEPARDAGLVDGRAALAVSQALHDALRRELTRRDGARLSKLLHCAATLAADLQAGRVRAHPFAYVHLLSAYKDAKHFAEGAALWAWLRAQDDAHCSQAAYGAAIELLSHAHAAALPELEALYDEGLQRFPGTFAAYHFAPDAIVAHRAQPVLIPGLPNTLFQGIITARVRAHDWRRAYLGLDTLLRLNPARTAQRVFELFVVERPLREAYTVFLMACRAGVQLSGGQVTNVLNRLRVAMTQSPALDHRFRLLRAMANALYAYQQSGATLRGVHVGQFLKAFEFMLPEKAPGQDFTPDETHLRNTIAVTAQQTVADLIQAGLPLSSSLFVPLMSLAGKLRAPELFQQTLDDAKAAGIVFYAVEQRTMLAAAGQLNDPELVKSLWSVVIAGANSSGVQLTYNDWVTFARACRRTGLTQYFEQQLQDQAHTISSKTESRARQALTDPEPGSAQSSLKLMTPEQLKAELQIIQAQMENIRAVLMSGQPLSRKHSPFYMHIDPDQPSLGTEQDLNTIYNEFTTDPHQPTAPADASTAGVEKALSATGIPYDELRFLNWVNVHELMAFASAHADANKNTISRAIAEGVTPKDLPDTLFRPALTPSENTADLHARIKKLRTLDPTHIPGTVVRKVENTPDPAAPAFHNEVPARHALAADDLVHTHTASDADAPQDTLDPAQSRWVSRGFKGQDPMRITRVRGYDKYRTVQAKIGELEAEKRAGVDEGELQGAEVEPKRADTGSEAR